jgi:hypothetical protein
MDEIRSGKGKERGGTMKILIFSANDRGNFEFAQNGSVQRIGILPHRVNKALKK